MNMRNVISRRTALGVGTVSAAVLAVGLAVVPASANHTGTFIPKSDLPSGSDYTPWSAGTVKKGLPSPMYTCIKNILPKSDSSYQIFSSDMTAEVREIITKTDSKKDAKKLVKKLRNAVTNCEDKLADVTDVERYGSYSTEDGLTIDGVYSAPEGSEYHFQLFGIGRDNKAVVVTTFSDMGQESDAPISKFTTTAQRALSKAF